jgi:DNA repair protein RecN (Recombination protein N)
VPREELAALVERLLAMSGQFEQRRLANRSFQLQVLDAYLGEEHLRRRAELARAYRGLAAARRRRDELARAAAGRDERLAELRTLVERTEGIEPGDEDALRGERNRLLHTAELATAATAAAEALAPEGGDDAGAAELVARAGAALGPVSGLARELAQAEAELVDAELRLRETGSLVRRFLAGLEADPGRLNEVEAGLERIADARRRFGAATTEELLERAAAARTELGDYEGGEDPLARAELALASLGAAALGFARELSEARRARSEEFAEAVAAELAGLGMGEGEFRAELAERELGPTGLDEVAFLVRPNAGLPFAPVAETASGGELSRVALALRAVAHASAGEPTVVFDEIDAGIGGRTANAVGIALRRLAERAQILTITHLPQIASLADAHFVVEKVPGDPTHTAIARLDEEARRAELERMLGGAEFLAALGREAP